VEILKKIVRFFKKTQFYPEKEKLEKKNELPKKGKKIFLQRDPFPDHSLLKEIVILDLRTPEEVEQFGKLPNSIHIPFDRYFSQKITFLDRNLKYGVVDLRGVYSKEGVRILKQAGIDGIELKGGFFYLTEVLNLKPILEEKDYR